MSLGGSKFWTARIPDKRTFGGGRLGQVRWAALSSTSALFSEFGLAKRDPVYFLQVAW